MDAGVSLEVSWSIELSTTDITAIRLLSWKEQTNEEEKMSFPLRRTGLPTGQAADPRRRTCVDSLVAGEVPLVAERSLAAVTLVWLVAVHLKHVLFEGLVLSKFRITFVAEERPVLCSG